MTLKGFVRQLFSFGMADILNEERLYAAPENVVVAGHPLHSVDEDCSIIDIQNDDEASGLVQFVVSGYSMSPMGIDDRDNLFARKVENIDIDVKENSFLVVKVDPDYYDHAKPNFKYKLRCAIIQVEASMSDEDIIEILKSMESQPEIWSESCQKCLKDKYAKAKSHYPNDNLMLSRTFQNGTLKYSFHKLDAIEYVATKLVKRDSGNRIITLNNAA